MTPANRYSFSRLREKVPKADEGALAGSLEANAFARCACESLFFVQAPKKSNQKKGAFLDTANQGFRCCGDFSTRHRGSVEKRRTSLCVALRVWRLAPVVSFAWNARSIGSPDASGTFGMTP